MRGSTSVNEPTPDHGMFLRRRSRTLPIVRNALFISLYTSGTRSTLTRRWRDWAKDTFDRRRRKRDVQFSRAYLEGLVARMKGDAAAAQAAFTAARAQQEEAVRARPDYGPTLCVLGLIDAALGRKEEALLEGRRALELMPIAKDSLDGADVLYFYAVICAWTGESRLGDRATANSRKNPFRAVLRRYSSEPILGLSPRRSALRKNRRLPRAERNRVQVVIEVWRPRP